MNIRAAQPDEAECLSAIAVASKSAWGYSAATIHRWSADLAISIEAIALLPTFVAEDGGEVCGFYMVSIDEGFELEHFWVAPNRMRQGIGKVLLKHAVGIVRDLGGKALRIDADPNAEQFYTACGARRVGQVAAPIAEDPVRVRPLLELLIAPSDD